MAKALLRGRLVDSTDPIRPGAALLGAAPVFASKRAVHWCPSHGSRTTDCGSSARECAAQTATPQRTRMEAIPVAHATRVTTAAAPIAMAGGPTTPWRFNRCRCRHAP